MTTEDLYPPVKIYFLHKYATIIKNASYERTSIPVLFLISEQFSFTLMLTL